MKSASEVKYLAEKFGWTAGPLTFKAVQNMNSDQARFHELFNKAEYERALGEPQAKKEAAKAATETERVKAENAKNKEWWDGKKFWESEVTPEGLRKVEEETELFHTIYPQLVLNNQQNGDALREWLVSKCLPVSAVNLSKAFQALAREGRLVLNPSVCGIIRIRLGDGKELEIKSEQLPDFQRRNPATIEGRGIFRKTVQKPVEILPAVESVTGSELANHPLLDTLLGAYDVVAETKRYNDSLSADEYRRQNGEAFRDPRAYANAADKIKREIGSFISFHPEYRLTEENKKHLCAFIEKRKLEFNRENLETAYGELVREEGYIETNPEAVVSSGQTKLVDFGGRPSPTKTPAEIRRMSAKEYQDWLNESPANREAANAFA
jgi:hypothetical protein